MTPVPPTAESPSTVGGPAADTGAEDSKPRLEPAGVEPTAVGSAAEPTTASPSSRTGTELSEDRTEPGSGAVEAETEPFRWPTWTEPGAGTRQGAHGRHEGVAEAPTAAAVAGAVGSALGAAGHAAGAVSQRVGIFAKAAAERAAERRAYRQAEEEEAERHRISLDQALLGAHEDLEPPLPMLPADTAAAPTRGQSKLALLIVAGFVVAALLVGLFGASQIGSNSDVGIPPLPSTTRTVAVTAPPQTVTVPPSQNTTEDSPDRKLAFLSASGFDPQGDGQERNGEAGRVWDGKKDTYWSSEGYQTADMGGLKDGAGVILDFGQTVKPSEVTVTLPDPSTFDLYLAPDRSLDGATKVGSSSDKSGDITIRVTGGASGQYLIVWFTRVSRVSDGAYRATLAEVTAKG